MGVLVASYSFWIWERLSQTTQLLAEAFSERRTIDLRYPGARYAAPQRERSARSLDPPRAWMEAELAITKALASNPSNPRWLEAAARADIFRWNYAEALEVLRRVRTSRLEDDPRLNADLAAAYFERAEAEGRGADYSSAAEALSKAIEQLPGSAELRFNRALIYERLFLYSQSSADWKEAVRIEPGGGWAAEARTHLAAVEKRPLDGQKPITPRAYLALRGSGFDSELALRPATEQWLQIVGERDGDERKEALEAMRALAADLAIAKHDLWLSELLKSPDGPLDRQAFAALARSIQANAAGHAEEAGRSAAESKRLFERTGNRAGALYSSFEANYAQQRALRGTDCAVANASLSRVIPGEFVWLGVQVWTERGVCDSYSGNPGAAWTDHSTAVRLAKEAGYREPAVRPLSYQNNFRANLGDSSGAWQGSLNGLAEVWARPHELISPFHFYNRMVTLASRAGDWNTALAIKREVIGTVASLGNPSLLGVHYYEAGTLALNAGDYSSARGDFQKAQDIFQALVQDDQIRAYLFSCELGRAEAEMKAGHARQAEARLAGIAGRFASFSEAHIQLRYQDLLGRVNLKLGNLSTAASSFRTACDLALKDRQSLRDPRQLTLWMSNNRDLYHSVVDLLLRQYPQGKQAWSAWREYLGAQIPSSIGLSISFAVFPDRVVAWLQQAGKVIIHTSPVSGAALEDLVTEFRRECSAPRTSIAEIRSAGGRLYQLLLQPFSDRLHGQVWVEPDGVLAGLPWETLVAANGHWAGDEATYVVALEGIRPVGKVSISPQSHMLAVAASNGVREHAPELPPLPDAAREARAVGGMFPHAVVLTGNDATFDNVGQAASHAEIFHFAGHHGNTGLLLSESAGQPDVLDLSSFAAPAHSLCRLAVLSACQTSATFSSDEWDPDTLIRTLHREGVPTVVASRWSVDSKITADFMKRFYECMLSGSAADAALQKASQAIRGQRGAEHPYYWAAFASFQ